MECNPEMSKAHFFPHIVPTVIATIKVLNSPTVNHTGMLLTLAELVSMAAGLIVSNRRGKNPNPKEN